MLWKSHKINDSLFVSAHPDLTITEIKNVNKSALLLGHLINPEMPHLDNFKVLSRLVDANNSTDAFIKSTFDHVGHWILIVSIGDRTILFHDCAGTKSVYYTDNMRVDELWVASQPRLIGNILDLKEERRAIDYITCEIKESNDYWWPGDKTPYSEIKALLPNHFLDLQKGKVFRYWPDRNLIPLGEKDGVEKIADRLQKTMFAAAQRFDLALALSGGFDSRVVLAASRGIKDRICVYNGKRPDVVENHPDILIPKRLAKKFNLESHYIPQNRNVDKYFGEIFFLNAPYAIHELLPGLQAEYKHLEQKKIGVTGNVAEVARFGFDVFEPYPKNLSGEYLSSIIKWKRGKKRLPFACEAMEDWYQSIDDYFNVNIFDLLYWEQRCGRWFSNNCLVFQMAYRDVFFPFNCRELLIDMLSISESDRMPDNYTLFKKLVQFMWPELLSEPINPKWKMSTIQRGMKKAEKIFLSPLIWKQKSPFMVENMDMSHHSDVDYTVNNHIFRFLPAPKPSPILDKGVEGIRKS